MDLNLYVGVLWRFRYVVLAGFILALALAFLSFVRVPSLDYRQSEEWASYSKLFVTQEGFPWGSSIIETPSATSSASGAEQLGTVRLAESRFSTLAILYSQLADSDAVRQIMLQDGPLNGTIEAAPVLTEDGEALPLISVAGIADTPARARTLTVRATDALLTYLMDEQQRNAIPSNERVTLDVVARAGKPKLLDARSITLPIVVFLTVMIAAVGLAFLLENLRPRTDPLGGWTAAAPSGGGAAFIQSRGETASETPASSVASARRSQAS